MPEPSLLVSIHDVSPVTWPAAREAVALAEGAGVPASALTLLVIARDGRGARGDADDAAALRRHPRLVGWLRGLHDRGATLVAHGLTHRMPRPVRAPHRAAWAYLFAAGQGELYTTTREEARARLSAMGDELIAAGLEPALAGFVPPAWLLSRGARAAVEAAGFDFVETMGGIRLGTRTLARRLIGWGARSRAEALATAAHARLQVARAPADTRLAIHPADVRSAICRRSIARTLARLLRRLEPRSYGELLRRTPA